MDILDDLLKQSGLKSRFIGWRSFSQVQSLKFPCAKSIGFHVVTQGVAFLHLESKAEPIRLSKGDIALMARGQNHIVSTEPKLTGALTSLNDFDQQKKSSHRSTKLTVVSGAYQFWNEPVHTFFNELPDWYVLKYDESSDFEGVQALLSVLAKEASQPELGSDLAAQGILDVLFPLIVRKLVKKVGNRAKTWSHAVHDSEIRKAIDHMHANVSKAWTVESLAKTVGLSRAGFAAKFKKSMGKTPLHYLTVLRIQKGIRLLSESEEKIETIAFEVGYQDAFGFSKAFKKLTGHSPRDFRARAKEPLPEERL